MSNTGNYQPRTFNLSGLKGISDRTLELHFKLYEGYVANTNKLNEEIAALSPKTAAQPKDQILLAELNRHLGFEYNGMVLHEYYFDNLKKGGTGEPDRASVFRKAVEDSFGSYASWKRAFSAVGNMRGVGWAICYQDPATGRLSNHWTSMHETGNVAGFLPVLVMDVWEHAFLLDYAPSDKSRYIEAFFSNVNWETLDRRLQHAPKLPRAAA